MKENIQIHIDIHIHFHQDADSPDEPDSRGKTQGEESFAGLAKAVIEESEARMSRKTIENYRTAVRSFLRFLGGDLRVADIGAGVVGEYAKWLRESGISLNTQSCYMRSLRAILNHAMAERGQDVGQWFRKVFMGNMKTEKRAVAESAIRKIQQLKLAPHSALSKARDFFLFSFFAQGMPFVDVAHLKKSQLTEDTIVYTRHKTGQRVSVKLEPCMTDIIGRYWTRQGDYVFPIIRASNPHDAEEEYARQLNRYNRALKILARRAGLSENLTSYVARHTWASVAFRSNVDLPVISKALGHTNPQTTLTYIKEIDDHRLEEANHTLLARFHDA